MIMKWRLPAALLVLLQQQKVRFKSLGNHRYTKRIIGSNKKISGRESLGTNIVSRDKKATCNKSNAGNSLKAINF